MYVNIFLRRRFKLPTVVDLVCGIDISIKFKVKGNEIHTYILTVETIKAMFVKNPSKYNYSFL
jgi:hypothetical protein